QFRAASCPWRNPLACLKFRRMNDVNTRPAISHEGDFFAWSQDKGRRLREIRPTRIDWQNVAEEIEGLGRSQRSEIRSRLFVALAHLLKWAHQPDKRNNSWRAAIVG